MRPVVVATLLLSILAVPALADTLVDAASQIDVMMAASELDQTLILADEAVAAVILVREFYHANGNAPAWVDPATVTAMLRILDGLRDDGLDPDDYHATVLADLGTATPTDPTSLARRDVLLTDALFVSLYHLSFGKADPERIDTDWNIDDLYDSLDLGEASVRREVTARVLRSVAEGDLDRLYRGARADLPLYELLRDAHARYRAMAEAGGWPEVPAGPTLREGDDDPRVAVLRRRLAATGDLPADQDRDRSAFDAELTAAVAAFQRRHGLDADGVVGKGTIAALNVPAGDRADQLRINLERARWVMHFDVGGNLVLVNIAAYEVWLVEGREVVWRSRVQVGKPYTRTPIFADAMTYLEFNPTWTVPASIANRSILPKVKADPGYLAANDMVLLDRSGSEVASDSVDWSTVTRMPYTVRQQPGPKNALGLVKFMFPNSHAVYLHDTPSRGNFDRSARAFSSGCIRVERPMELAARLLADQPRWTRDHIDTVVASGERTTVRLTEPLPVFLLYWTAYVDDDGSIQFRPDLYDRDPAVLAALDGAIQPRRRHRE